MKRCHPPVVAAPGGLVGLGKRRADHHRVGPARDGLGHVAARPHSPVGDHVDVAAGFAQMLHPGTGGIGDCGGLRHAHAQHASRRAGGSRPNAHEHTDRARAHQVQRRLVGGAAPHDHGDVERGDELLQIERLGTSGNVLGRDHRPLDHQDVQLGLQDVPRVAGHALGGKGRRRDDAGLLDLANAPDDELVLDALGVELLHATGGLLGRQVPDLIEDRLRVLVAGLEALQVEDGEPTQTADLDRHSGRHHAVHGAGHHRQAERPGVDLPRHVHVVGVPGPSGGDDGHLVEPVGPPGRLADADLDLHTASALRRSHARSGCSERPPGEGAGVRQFHDRNVTRPRETEVA